MFAGESCARDALWSPTIRCARRLGVGGGGAGTFDENISVDHAMVEQLKVACEATPGPAGVEFARPRFG